MIAGNEELGMASISDRENREIETVNASGSAPVLFFHGLWLLPSSTIDHGWREVTPPARDSVTCFVPATPGEAA
jgi:hypothetical protein